jgi:hypothetical protein
MQFIKRHRLSIWRVTFSAVAGLAINAASAQAPAAQYNPYANTNNALIMIDEVGGNPTAPKFVFGCAKATGNNVGRERVMAMLVPISTANVFKRTPTTAWLKVSFGDSANVALIGTIGNAKDVNNLISSGGWNWSDDKKSDTLRVDIPFSLANTWRLLKADKISIEWETPDPKAKHKPVAQKSVYSTKTIFDEPFHTNLKQNCNVE